MTSEAELEAGARAPIERQAPHVQMDPGNSQPPRPGGQATPLEPLGLAPGETLNPASAWKRVVIDRYAAFHGRASPQEFWLFVIATILIESTLFSLGTAIGRTDASLTYWLLSVYALATLLPSLAVTVRRLHDGGNSGWVVAIVLIPFIGWFVVLVFTCLGSTPVANRYGDPDRYAPGSEAGAPSALPPDQEVPGEHSRSLNPLSAWKLVVFRRYAQFAGRATRQEFWMFAMPQAVAYVAIIALWVAVDSSWAGQGAAWIVTELYVIGTFLPALAVTVRRLHDSGKTGWWLAFYFTSIGALLILIFLLLDSTRGPNEYGESEKYPATAG